MPCMTVASLEMSDEPDKMRIWITDDMQKG